MPSLRQLHRETIRQCDEQLAQVAALSSGRLPEAVDDMTDWGDAMLNEKARPRTWPLPPASPETGPEAQAAARRAKAEGRTLPSAEPPDVPLGRHDKGSRIIPPPAKGES